MPQAPRIAIVTGADAKFLLMAGALRQSLVEAGWTGMFRICDFGLGDRQAGMLRDAGWLLPRPGRLASGLHPFLYKASLADYTASLDADLLVWIDCDMIVADDPVAALAELGTSLSVGGFAAAICADAGVASIAEACRRLAMRPFQDALVAAGIGENMAYLNTGFVAIGDRRTLEAWRDLADAMPVHALFEQNAFNLLAHTGRCRVLQVPAARWNVHGPLLAMAQPGRDGDIQVGTERAVLLHATSPETSQHEIFEGKVTMAGGVFHGHLKLFRNPALRRLQVAALNRWSLDPVARACSLDATDP
jgi:hypothetical protein